MAARPLEPLHARLQAWRRARQVRRLATAASAWLLAAIWGVAGLMVLDASLHLSRAARLAGGLVLLAVLGLCAAALMISIVRARESLVSLALQWEASLRSEGDLVAALQFEERVIRGTALPLERALVEYVAECAPHLPAPPPERSRPWTVVALAASGLIIGAWFAAQPAAAAARLKRLVLVDAPRASSTRIVSFSVTPSRTQGSGADSHRDQLTHALLVPAWQPLRLRVAVAGPPPARAEVKILPTSAQAAVCLPLRTAMRAGGATACYTAKLPALAEPVTCEVHTGDAPAWRVRLTPVSPPTVSLKWRVAPADDPDSPAVDVASPQLVVPPNARLQLIVQSPQRLSEVELLLGRTSHVLARTENGAWRLRKPLAAPRRAERQAYRVRIRDASGLTWGRLVDGEIRVRMHAPLTVSLAVPTKAVLARGEVELQYLARGGRGVARLDLHLRLWREDSLAAHQQRPLGVGPGRPKIVAGSIWLALAELRALPGDVLEVRVEAASAEGNAVYSEPLRVAVVDPLALVEQLRRPETWLVSSDPSETIDVQGRAGAEEAP